jgi:MFS family permease
MVYFIQVGNGYATCLHGLHRVRDPIRKPSCDRSITAFGSIFIFHPHLYFSLRANTPNLFRTFTCISVVPVAGEIVDDLTHGESARSASIILVTIWELGEAAGPLLIAPLSEVFGRYPVLVVANSLFIGTTILAALSQNVQVFIMTRVLTGLVVVSNVLNPAIIGDLFIPEQRGSAMSIIMLAPLIGGAVGPAIGGAVAQNWGWRQVVWMSAGLAIVCEVVLLTYFKETYKMAILKRRAGKLRKMAGSASLDGVIETKDKQGYMRLWDSIMRPGLVLSSSGILMALSLFGSVAFTHFYVMSVTLPDILELKYGLSPAQRGIAFTSFSQYLPATFHIVA